MRLSNQLIIVLLPQAICRRAKHISCLDDIAGGGGHGASEEEFFSTEFTSYFYGSTTVAYWICLHVRQWSPYSDKLLCSIKLMRTDLIQQTTLLKLCSWGIVIETNF